MGSDQFPIRLVWRTDVHCADQAPSSRTDDWVETVMDKLVQVGQIAKEVGADAVLDGGDFFNPKAPVRTSHRLMQHIVRVHQLHYDCPVLGNVGNHDVRHSQLSNLPESPLGTLFETEVFERCYTVRHHDTGEVEQHYPASFGGAGGPVVQVEGIPYHGPKYDMRYFKGIKKNERSDFLVVMAHVLASPHGGSMFAGEDIIKYQDLLELNPDVDAWCFGHWHKNQGVVEIAPGKWVVNIGSLTRGSLSEDNVDRIPQVAVLTFTDKIEIETRNLKVKPAEEVFDLAKRDREEARTMTIDAFVQQVQDSLINTADKKDLVEVVRGMEEVPAKVRDKTLEYMSKAER